jgi:hypothetical protein
MAPSFDTKTLCDTLVASLLADGFHHTNEVGLIE